MVDTSCGAYKEKQAAARRRKGGASVQVHVHFRELEPSETVVRYAHRITDYHLGRFGHEVSSVDLWLTAAGADAARLGARCQIVVRGPSVHATKLDVLSTDALLAMDAATEWAGRTVASLLDGGASPERKLRKAS